MRKEGVNQSSGEMAVEKPLLLQRPGKNWGVPEAESKNLSVTLLGQTGRVGSNTYPKS